MVSIESRPSSLLSATKDNKKQRSGSIIMGNRLDSELVTLL